MWSTSTYFVHIRTRNTRTVPLRQTVRRGVKAVWQTSCEHILNMKQILRKKTTTSTAQPGQLLWYVQPNEVEEWRANYVLCLCLACSTTAT